MTITIELSPMEASRLSAAAAAQGKDPNRYAAALLAAALERDTLGSERQQERRRLLAAGAEALAEEYREDLARPAEERELTAITALDADPLHEESLPAAEPPADRA